MVFDTCFCYGVTVFMLVSPVNSIPWLFGGWI